MQQTQIRINGLWLTLTESVEFRVVEVVVGPATQPVGEMTTVTLIGHRQPDGLDMPQPEAFVMLDGGPQLVENSPSTEKQKGAPEGWELFDFDALTS